MKTKSFIALTISITILALSIHALGSNGIQPEIQNNGSLDASWLSGWSFRKAHNITGSITSVQTNYPILLSVHYDNGYDIEGDVYLGGKCRTDFGDIRFTDSTGTGSLSYYMQQKVDSVYAIFWVKISYIPASPDYTTIFVYYGNSTATTTSNKDLTLSLYDDFEDGTTQGWAKSWGTYVTSDGVSSIAYQGVYSRTAGRNYGSDAAGTGHFYERFDKTLYLTSGSYLIEGAMRFDDSDFYRIPQGIRLLVNELNAAETSYPGTNWRLLNGNFTLDSSGTIMLSTEFHLLATSNLLNGAETYHIDRMLVRKWCDPEPAHGTWGPEAAWMGPPPLGDVNGDGKVDVQDLHIVGEDYGKRYP